eukprot:6327379-Pyramimonas_sp.AAC.1
MSSGHRVTNNEPMTLHRKPRSSGSLNDGCRSHMRAIEMRPDASEMSAFMDRAAPRMQRSVAVVCEHRTEAT